MPTSMVNFDPDVLFLLPTVSTLLFEFVFDVDDLRHRFSDLTIIKDNFFDSNCRYL